MEGGLPQEGAINTKMDEYSPKLTYAESLTGLIEILDAVERPGDYCCSGAAETAPPLLNVDGAGLVSFPVPPEQARSLIKGAAEKAPYGRGDETLIDESVRKVWQIPPEKIHLSGKRWTSALDDVIRRVEARLGCPNDALKAELYKLLVYDKGGFFLAHRDTEKAPGMVGTLIVALPSEQEGGELVVRHSGRESVHDLCNLDPGLLRFAAFYADCEHEVLPIASGYRICLVYNLLLVKTKTKKKLSTPDMRPVVAAAARQLRQWTERSDRADKIVHLLEHRYTEAALSFEVLKGRDAALAEALRQAASEADCAFHLGMVHIEESGWAEFAGDYGYGSGWRSRYRDEEEDADEDDFEIGEVCDWSRFIDQWRDEGNRPADYGAIPINENEILPVGALDDEEPDETHFSEASGNEGASFERTYLRAALVLWPKADFDAICASAGFDATLARLEQRVEQALTGDEPEAAREGVAKLAAIAAESWPEFGDSAEEAERFIGALARHGELELLEREARPLLEAGKLPARQEPLVEWAWLAGPASFRSTARILFGPSSPTSAIASLKLWTALANLWTNIPDAEGPLNEMLELVRDKLGAIEQGHESPDLDLSYEAMKRLVRSRISGLRKRPEAPVVCPAEALARFLRSVEKSPAAERLMETLNALFYNLDTFPPAETLAPAAELCASKRSLRSPRAAQALWKRTAEVLLDRASAPPSSPSDWTLPLTRTQREKATAEILAFALDPNKSELRLKLRAELRQEIHRLIDDIQLDMTHVTERKGRPYTLVLTKTLAHYDRACERYKADVDGFKRLLGLAKTKKAGDAETAARIEMALQAGANWKPAQKIKN